MAIIQITQENIFKKVTSETIEKIYGGDVFSVENELELRRELSFSDENTYWFNVYFSDSIEEVSELLKIINIRELAPIKLENGVAKFSLMVSNTFSLSALIQSIHQYIVFKIVYRWFITKGKIDTASIYEKKALQSRMEIIEISAGLWNKKYRAPFYGIEYKDTPEEPDNPGNPEEPEKFILSWGEIIGNTIDQQDLINFVTRKFAHPNANDITGNILDNVQLMQYINDNIVNPYTI